METTGHSLTNLHEVIEKKERILSIDVFRGLAIVAMIFVNSISDFYYIPTWSKHAADYGLTYVDLVAPFFIFAIALTYKLSFDKHLQSEKNVNTYVRFLRRYAALLAFGIIGGDYFFTLSGIHFGWGALQAIGIAGLITLLFIRFPKLIRFGISITLLILYQYILTLPIIVEGVPMSIADLNLNDIHGGLIGGVGWGIMMLLSTVVIDEFHQRKMRRFLIWGAVILTIGIFIHLLWLYTGFPAYGGISKCRVTASYVLTSVGASALLFIVVWYLYDQLKIMKNSSKFFQPLGKNAIFIYLLHALTTLLIILTINEYAPAILVVSLAVINIIVLWGIAVWMDRKKIYIVI
jgi:predicted acyltransferase